MQSHYPASFDREMGSTEPELLQQLPGAVGPYPLRTEPGRAVVTIGEGTLDFTWKPLPPRRIGLFAMPRLAVRFVFDNVADDARQRFMKYFDLYTQRGGG